MKGKTCVITGASGGIGLVAAERLGQRGAALVLVGRNRAKGEAALDGLRRRVPGLAATMLYADLAVAAELRRVAGEIAAAAPRIDVLVNNAGAIFARREATRDGLERSFALNHIGYFLLTHLLRERVAAAAPSRIVNVASEAHRGATLDFADLQNARSYSGWQAYRRSKLANILFTRALARRLAGTGVTANCLHPGFVASGFGDNNGGLFRLGMGLAKLFAISPEKGAQTIIHLAAAPELATVSGGYFAESRPATPSVAAQDDAAAEQLWRDSLRLAGLPPEGPDA